MSSKHANINNRNQVPPSQIKCLLSVMPPENDPKYLKHGALIDDTIKNHNLKHVQLGPVSNTLIAIYCVLIFTTENKGTKSFLQEWLPLGFR